MARISRIDNYRAASWSAASLCKQGISSTELPFTVSISGKNGVVPIGNDATSPWEAMTENTFEFVDTANPCIMGWHLPSNKGLKFEFGNSGIAITISCYSSKLEWTICVWWSGNSTVMESSENRHSMRRNQRVTGTTLHHWKFWSLDWEADAARRNLCRANQGFFFVKSKHFFIDSSETFHNGGWIF